MRGVWGEDKGFPVQHLRKALPGLREGQGEGACLLLTALFEGAGEEVEVADAQEEYGFSKMRGWKCGRSLLQCVW